MTGEMTLSISSGAMLVMLGAYHGINPGMGWLFAVALGMQERRRAAECRALLPLGMGHALAVAAAVAIALIAGAVIPIRYLRWPVAGMLLVLGVSRLFRHRHPRWVGMRVGSRGLTIWSFLMASAHGAGLMVAPVLLGLQVYTTYHSLSEISLQALAAASLHVAAMLVVIGVVSEAIYENVGLGILRRGWFNLDLGWSFVLIASGAATLFTSV